MYLNIKCKIIKILAKAIENLQDVGLGKDFLDFILKYDQYRIAKVYLIKVKNFCFVKVLFKQMEKELWSERIYL